MKKKILSVIAVLMILGLLVAGAIPVRAAESQAIPRLIEKLEPGWSRVSPTTTMHVTGVQGKNAEVEYKITSAPITLDDNRTLIDNKWYLQIDPSGQWWFENGNNVFKSRVTKDKVTVLDKKGRLTNYESALAIETKSYEGGVPKIADDPLSGQIGSCLAWEYGTYGKGSTLTRYLRSNNSRLSELWVLTGPPNTSVIFRPNIAQENKYEAKTTPMIAFDANYHMVNVTENMSRGYYVINPKDLEGITYPLYVDPTYDFYVGTDGWIEETSSVYNTAWSSSTGYAIDGDFPAHVGQYLFIGSYQVNRSFVMFDTSLLDDSLNVTATYLYLYGYSNDSDTDFQIYICSGMPTYPHNPVVAGDFNKSLYTTDGGSGYSTSSGWYTSGFNVLTLTNTGWVNKTGYTKFALRSSKDIAGIAPTGDEYVSFWQQEHGTQYAPNIRVIGTIPIVTPTVTTNPASAVTTGGATLNGYLSSDGGASCSVRFEYGTTTGYGLTTAWTAGYTSGESFSSTIAGLSPGTTYHYRAVASNTAATGYGSDSTFTAGPSAPTYFSATGGNAQVTLSWTKGTGANKTYINRKVGSYPTTIDDGTNVYNNTGTNVVDGPLVNGTTYYYTAWSLALDGVTYSQNTAQSFATPQALGPPGIATGSASSIVVDGAMLSGTLTSLGGYASADCWFDYGKTLAYELGSTMPQTLTAPGVFTDTLSGLDAATLYHFRASASGTGGTSHGSDATFTTGAAGAPTMTTNAATGVQITAAQLNGTVTSDGGAPPVTVWFQYGLTTQYELGVTPTAAGLYTGGTFYYGLSGLTTGTTYHYRAVGQNTQGTSYGGDQSFVTTSALAPTVNTNVATNVGAAQATLQGIVVSDGGTSCSLSFEWGTTIAYGNTITATPATGTASTTFSAIITGLQTSQTYHYRAVATNNGGTGNGPDVEFTTVFAPPTNFLAVATSSSGINLSWVAQGDQTYVAYKETGYPVDRSDGTQVYFGSGTTASLSGLEAGTTYYFSAWSWKQGDVWTQTNATAIATTFASTTGNVVPPPEVPDGEEPLTPSSWFDIPENSIIKNFPLYDVLTGWATAYQIPEGSFWAFVSLVASTIVGALIFVTWRQAVPAVGGSLLIIVIAGLIHACPPIFAAFIAAIEIGGAYGLMSLGGNIAGKGA